MNKTSISSVVCFDIIDFAKKSELEQQAAKKQFDALINLAVVDIPEKDRLIVDTGHGAIITCSGALESALEDALFIALTVRDEVLNNNAKGESPLYLLIGINLGSVKVATSTNVNEAPNIIGEGLVEAQRIMSFANPNQILVSRAYYDMASKLTLEVAQMFEKYDMHAYEHDIYAVRLLNEKAAIADNAAVIPEQIDVEEDTQAEKKFNKGIYVLPILLAFAMLFAFTKWVQEPEGLHDEPTITMEPATEHVGVEDQVAVEASPIEAEVAESELVEATTEQEALPKEAASADQATVKKKAPAKAKAPKKAIAKKPQKESATQSAHESVVTEDKVAEQPENVADQQDEEKSGWESFKDSLKEGAVIECTQAQRALNQCN